MAGPLYKHDCDRCFRLFTEDDRDYYFCGGTIIIRLSDEPSDNLTYSVEIIDRLLPKKLADRILTTLSWID